MADEPNGYPVWLSPFVSGINAATVAESMDFLGTAEWSASETPLGDEGCLTTGFMLGTGVAVYNSPLAFRIGHLPIVWEDIPAAGALMGTIDAAVQDAAAQLGEAPLVGELLDTILGALPTGTGL